jgi:hypothetical protein
MNYTFYGDLLGISGMYKLSPNLAKERLNEFYSTTFYNVDDEWLKQDDGKIMMFSDSFFMWGSDAEGALRELGLLYLKLLHKGLLLRGAIVSGSLQFEPRIVRKDFEKYLPQDDTLARAVGLESTHKGARLFVESQLAVALLANVPEWQSVDGYIREPRPNTTSISYDSPLRRISPTPENTCYEYLYFWGPDRTLNHHKTDYDKKRAELDEIQKMLKEDVATHYKETSSLLKRCEHRHSFTDKELP